MRFDKKKLALYAVTDRRWLAGASLSEKVEEALKGGATFLQLREKNLDDETFLAEAKEIQQLCRRYQAPFVINDKVEMALALDADGVHVGQKDMTVAEVRKRLGPDKIIGVTARTVEQAILAEKNGADYLGAGAVFSTGTKKDTSRLSYETLKEICQAVTIPVVAIGGITADNVLGLAGSGIAGIAVVSGIFAQKNVAQAATELKGLVESGVIS